MESMRKRKSEGAVSTSASAGKKQLRTQVSTPSVPSASSASNVRIGMSYASSASGNKQGDEEVPVMNMVGRFLDDIQQVTNSGDFNEKMAAIQAGKERELSRSMTELWPSSLSRREFSWRSRSRLQRMLKP